MRVQLPPLPPNSPGVPGTKCGRGRVDRRRSVEPSTRIQFPPATPIHSGPSSNGTGPSPPKAEIPVRIRMGRPSFDFQVSGARKTANPLRSDRRGTGFDSQVPDQSFSGIAKLGRRRTVNADTRRFESCSRSHAGLTQTGRVPLLQSGCPWFDSRTPHQFSTLP